MLAEDLICRETRSSVSARPSLSSDPSSWWSEDVADPAVSSVVMTTVWYNVFWPRLTAQVTQDIVHSVESLSIVAGTERTSCWKRTTSKNFFDCIYYILMRVVYLYWLLIYLLIVIAAFLSQSFKGLQDHTRHVLPHRHGRSSRAPVVRPPASILHRTSCGEPGLESSCILREWDLAGVGWDLQELPPSLPLAGGLACLLHHRANKFPCHLSCLTTST